MKYYDYLDNEEENKIKHVLENETKSDALHGIIVLGVDNYVIVNEMYGRQYGEFILRHVNDIILDMFRGSDIIVRLRGDEFIILSRNIKELGNIRSFNRMRVRRDVITKPHRSILAIHVVSRFNCFTMKHAYIVTKIIMI